MNDVTPRTRRMRRADTLLNTVSPEALQSPPPQAGQEGPPRPATAKAVREQAKRIAASVMAELPGRNRATRRALEKAVRAGLPKNPVPTDRQAWLTPEPTLTAAMGALGISAFTIDAASNGPGTSNVNALTHFTKDDAEGGGLKRRWLGSTVWFNPPYKLILPWVVKAREAVQRGDARIVIGLLPASVGAKWYHENIVGHAHVLFLRGRLCFDAAPGQPGGPAKDSSMLVIWGGTADQIRSLAAAFPDAEHKPLPGWDAGCAVPAVEPPVAAQADEAEAVSPEELEAGETEVQECLRTIDLFTGGGSVPLAMEAAGFMTAFANDFCPEKRETFSANFPHVRLDPRSITDIRGHELPRAGTMVASFPCPDHSTSGKRLGFAGDRGVLAFEVVRLVRELAALGRAPGVVVFENVLGLLEHDEGKDFATLVEALMTEGYDVGALVIDARLFVPQSRRRVFIVAVRSGTPFPPGVESSRPSSRWHPLVLQRAHAALSAGARRCWHWLTIPNPPKRTTNLADILEPVVPNTAWATEEAVEGMVARLPSKELAKIEHALKAGNRVGIIKDRRGDKGEERHLEVFFDGIARCLQKGEGGNRQRLVVLDESAPNGMRVRDFTPRERARLTGLPDDYVLPKVTQSRRLTGDAVVVPVYEWLARHLIRLLTEAAEACRKKAGVVPVVTTRAKPRLDGLGEARDAMGQVIVKPGANRPSKQVSVRTEVTNLLEADIEIEAHAKEEGVSKAELYRRAYNFYRHSQEKALLPGYVPLARTPELRPKTVREAEARLRRRRTREAAGNNAAGEGDIATLRRRAFTVSHAVRLSPSRLPTVAQRPGTCRTSFPRSATSAARGGSRPTWRDGPRAAACWSSRSQAARPWRSGACSPARSSGPSWSSASRA